jgi:hypothetical protein
MRFSILILFGVISCAFSTVRADDQFIKVTGDGLVGYIIPKEYADRNLREDFEKSVSGFWTPTTDQARAAEAAVAKILHGSPEKRSSIVRVYSNMTKAEQVWFLKNFEEQSRPYILKNYKNYTVQFIGLIIKGEKRIQCHYLLNADSKMESSSYFLGPIDGGASAWNILFDVASGTCSNYEDMGSA